jgi:hypothetical protein
MHFKKFLLTYTLIPLLVLSAGAGYYKFQVLGDYMITYEGWCDELNEECYVGCEDETCTEEYYFTYVSRHVRDIESLCGPDITDCDEADYCQEDEITCEVEYCDNTDDECESFSPADTLPEAKPNNSEL